MEFKRKSSFQTTNINKVFDMAKRKPIKIRRTTHKQSTIKLLATECGVSTRTVYNALHWHSDTENENKVRKIALELYAKQF
jgi:transcriptional antiterminator